MRCPHCNAPVPAGNDICLDCGKRFVVDTSASVKRSASAAQEKSSARVWGTGTEGATTGARQAKAAGIRQGQNGTKKQGSNRFLVAVLGAFLVSNVLFGVLSELGTTTGTISADWTGTSSVEYNEDGSYQEAFYFDGECDTIVYYDADGVLYKDELYDQSGDLIYVTWYEDNQEVRSDYYQDNTLVGTWYMEYEKAASDEEYLCCEYFICVGDTEWSYIYFYGEDDGNIYVIGEAERDPDTGELIYCSGTDNNGNDLADLYG